MSTLPNSNTSTSAFARNVLSIAALAVPPDRAAAMLGISRAQFYKLNGSGRLPAPLRLGTRSPRWSVAELTEWLDAGCPDRLTWENLRGDAASASHIAESSRKGRNRP